ncbi:MAG TPA: hypothetical protein VE972_11140 [Conexibacter sp.]|nr:hypothetical protein [Conexibacter sp.]
MPETSERFDVPAGLDFELSRLPAPAPPGVLESARRHPLLLVGPLLVALALALAVGLTRAPVYTATARLRVAGFDPSVPGALTGYATTAVALAATYSWSVDEPAVVRAVARRAGVTEQRAADALSASAIPESPVFRVRAQGADARRVVAIANAAGAALTHERLGMPSAAQRAGRLRALHRAAASLATARAVQHQRQLDPGNANALAQAEAAVAAAQVAFDARRAAYLAGAQAVTATPAVQIVAPARRAVSDRRATLQLLLVIGLAAGLGAGLALALLAERRRAARP